MQQPLSIDPMYLALPKVELHRHLEGSLRLRTLVEVARAHGLSVTDTGQLRSLVEINSQEPYTYENFLSKFKTLRLFYRTPEIIGRIAYEAIMDAAQDHIRYMELRFTPAALSEAQGFSLAEVLDWVIEGTSQAKGELGGSELGPIETALIVSLNRHESPQLADQIIALALDRREAGIVGIDLAGNEANFPARPFASIFQEARKAGLHITVHAGEWAGAENVKEAILHLGAERIGHGIRVMEDAFAVELAREYGTVFEVCITSNFQSGVVSSLSTHPLPRMLAAGLNVTLNTDDPSISNITLSQEFQLAGKKLGMPLETLYERVMAAGNAVFLPERERQRLVRGLENELKGCSGK
jgi:adenosine deaminase